VRRISYGRNIGFLDREQASASQKNTVTRQEWAVIMTPSTPFPPPPSLNAYFSVILKWDGKIQNSFPITANGLKDFISFYTKHTPLTLLISCYTILYRETRVSSHIWILRWREWSRGRKSEKDYYLIASCIAEGGTTTQNRKDESKYNVLTRRGTPLTLSLTRKRTHAHTRARTHAHANSSAKACSHWNHTLMVPYTLN
jgi:hypothetical protein